MPIDHAHLYRRARQLCLRAWETLSNSVDLPSSVDCDLWLVCHPKDFGVASLTIESARRFVLNPLRQIYFVSTEQLRPTWLPSDVEYVFEGDVPGVQDVSGILKGEPYRGWILQQILKYSGAFFSRRYIVLDCDTVLLRPHLYFSERGTVLRLAYEHTPHYRALEKTLGINASSWASFVCHMMPFDREVLLSMFQHIESRTGMDWRLYFASYAKQHGMVMSEWDLYARFLIQGGYPHHFRPWINQSAELAHLMDLDSLIAAFGDKRNNVSLHWSDRPLVLKDGATNNA